MKKLVFALLFLASCCARPYQRDFIISEEPPQKTEEVVYSPETKLN